MRKRLNPVDEIEMMLNIYGQVADKKPVKEVAEAFGVSPRTIRRRYAYVKQMLDKLSVMPTDIFIDLAVHSYIDFPPNWQEYMKTGIKAILHSAKQAEYGRISDDSVNGVKFINALMCATDKDLAAIKHMFLPIRSAMMLLRDTEKAYMGVITSLWYWADKVIREENKAKSEGA